MSTQEPKPTRSFFVQDYKIATIGIITTAVVAWVYWQNWASMWVKWDRDPRYSHGYFVPLFAVYLLWSRRAYLQFGPRRSHGYGLLCVVVGLAIRAGGVFIYNDWFASLSLLPVLLGIAILAYGTSGFRWAWPAVAFLVFMMPLPYRFEIALTHPLQGVATSISTYLLQTVGFVAVAEGNTIRMGDGIRLGVVEACSGLSMVMIFLALTTAVAILMKRPWYERVIVLASTIPVALLANIIRITSTGILHKLVSREFADRVFHDFAGWLMMPLALGMLWVIIKVVSRLILDIEPERAIGTVAKIPARTAELSGK